MVYSKPENKDAVSTLFVDLMISVVFCLGWAVSTQAQDAQRNSSDESWTATSDTSVKNAIPSRTTESHSKSGNRSVDKQRVEVLGPNGGGQAHAEHQAGRDRVD